jgi:hypothetical protein
MKFFSVVLSLFVFLNPLQEVRRRPIPVAGGGASWTHNQTIIGRAAAVTNVSISGAVVTITFDNTTNKPGSSFGTGHAAIIHVLDFNGTSISNTTPPSGGCGTWNVPTANRASSGPAGGISTATCQSTTPTTSVAITMTATPTDVTVWVEEATCSGTIGTVVVPTGIATSTQANPPGVAMTVSGNNFVTQFVAFGGSQPSAISGSYTLKLTDSNGGSLPTVGMAYGLNLTSVPAPTWTGNDYSVANGVAFPCS